MNHDVMFTVHNEHLAQLRDEAAHERLLRSVERANAKSKSTKGKFWRAIGKAPHHPTVRPA